MKCMTLKRIVLNHLGQSLLLGVPINASDMETIETFLLFNFGPSHLYISSVGFVSSDGNHCVMSERSIVIAPGDSNMVLSSDAYVEWLAGLSEGTLQIFRDKIIPKEDSNMMKLAIEGYSSIGKVGFEIEVRLHRLVKKVAFKVS